MPAIPFNFSTREDLRVALDSLRCSDRPSISTDTDYLSPLSELAREFGPTAVGDYGLENARTLALGCYRDIVVVLQEPANSASDLPPSEVYENSETCKWIDRRLSQISMGVRNLGNTRIFDVRPFRNPDWRERDDEVTRQRLDERAYQAFEEMICLAKPDIILVCQCQTTNANNALARNLSSSLDSAGTLRLIKILNRKMIIAQAFHPSYFLRYYRIDNGSNSSDTKVGHDVDTRSRDLQRRRATYSESLLELAFLTAINATMGRNITGRGRDNLSSYSLKGEIEEHVTVAWCKALMTTSPKLIEYAMKVKKKQEIEKQEFADVMSKLSLSG